MHTYTVRWVSDYATITTVVEMDSDMELDDEIFGKALAEFIEFHGFNPEDHGFREDEFDEC
jgi:hypothetical protein